MCHKRIPVIVFSLFSTILLFLLAGCQAETDLPVIVARIVDKEGNAYIEAVSLNSHDQYPLVKVDSGSSLTGKAAVNSDHDLFVNTNFYIKIISRISPDGTYEMKELPVVTDFHTLIVQDKLILVPYWQEGMIVVSQDLSLRTIALPENTSQSDYNYVISIVRGKGDEVMIVYALPIEKDGEWYARVLVVDIESEKVTEKMLSVPSTGVFLEGEPVHSDLKYYLQIKGASPDLSKILYCYEYLKADTFFPKLALYSVGDGKELLLKDYCCSGCNFTQYKDKIITLDSPNDGCDGPDLLSMEGLEPVFDLTKLLDDSDSYRVTIHPHGDNWTIATFVRVLVVSPKGELLKSYDLPPEFVGSPYDVAAPFED
jgi:hypothetical protein